MSGAEKQVVSVPTRAPDGSRSECTLSFHVKHRGELTYSGEPLGEFTVVESDLVACLAAVRERLEKQGWRILCNGSRRDAWASPLSRQSSGGLRTYLLDAPNRSGGPADLVYLFDAADPDRIATVAEQRAYVVQRLFPNSPPREDWTPPLRTLRFDVSAENDNATFTLRSLTIHKAGMKVGLRLSSPRGDVPPPVGRMYPRVDLRVWDDVGVTYEPSGTGSADGGVVNCGWVREGLWDLTSWLRPTIDRAARQLNLELSALRWSAWDGVGNLEPRVWEPGLWRFSVDVTGS